MPANRTSHFSADLDRYVTAVVKQSVTASLQPLQTKVRFIAAQLAADDIAFRDRLLAAAVQEGKISAAERGSWAVRYDQAPEVIAEVLAERQPGYAGPVLTPDDDAMYEALFGTS